MEKNRDRVRPSAQEVAQALALSKAEWISSVFKTDGPQTIPDSCFRMLPSLAHVPAMPDESRCAESKKLKKVCDSEEWVTFANSTWKVTGCADCGLGGMLKETETFPITLGVKKPTSINLCGAPGLEPIECVSTAIFSAVAYIFSKRLVELQGHGDGSFIPAGRVYYTQQTAPIFEIESHIGTPKSAFKTDIYLGEIDHLAARWWQALLARGNGWMAEVTTNDKGTFLAPWSIDLGEERSLSWKRVGLLQKQQEYPPSAAQATEFLANFCRLHKVGNRFCTAVAMASILPIHNTYNLPVKFQWSQFAFLPPEGNETLDLRLRLFWDFLGQHITLSCNPVGMLSNLCSAFWEPSIACNTVHAWLYPIYELLPKLTIKYGDSPDIYHRALLSTCAARCPQFACFTLGTILTGLMPLVLRFVKSGLPMLDLDAAAWSSCGHSFIQGAGPTRRNSTESMHRADVWRLLYLTGEHLHPPLSPWKPFGETRVEDLPLEVRTHIECASSHYLRYNHWNWKLANGSTLKDYCRMKPFYEQKRQLAPFVSNPETSKLEESPIPTDLDDATSKYVTHNAFLLVFMHGDGYSPNERDIYEHDWIKARLDYSTADDYDADDPEPDGVPMSRLEEIQKWVLQSLESLSISDAVEVSS